MGIFQFSEGYFPSGLRYLWGQFSIMGCCLLTQGKFLWDTSTYKVYASVWAEPQLAGSPGSEQSAITSKVVWEFTSKSDS